MDVERRLGETDWPIRWHQLGVHEHDRGPLQALVDTVLDRPDDLAIVQHLADTVLLPHIGDYLTVFDEGRPVFGEQYADHELMRGALPTVALLATADDVHAAHLARGIPDDLSWKALADFGHQVAKCRWVEGRTGNHNQDWLRNAWSDGFLWLGRFEFELTRGAVAPGGDEMTVIGVHIPDSGPMPPDAVAEAFTLAAELMPKYYPEVGPVEWFTCHSWLLDPHLQQVVPHSNIASFQALWEVWDVKVADRDAYYFAFNVEPETGRELPYGLDGLPTGSRLHRAMVEHWRAGGHFQAGGGRIPVGRYR